MTHGGNIFEIEKQYGVKHQNLIDYSANINPLGVPESLKKILKDSIEDLINYPDINYNDLKRAIGEKYKVSVEKIYVGNGGVQVIFDYIRAAQPKKSLVVYPTFIEYERALRAIDCEIKEFFLKEEEDFVLNVEDLLEEINNDEGLDMVILCNPNNPTGTLSSKEKLRPLLNLCRERNIFLMVDEAFMDFVEGGDEISLLRECENYPNLLITRSFTKFYGIPGLRLGFGLCHHHKVTENLNRIGIPWTVNTFASRFGKVLLEEVAYEEETHQWLKNETKSFVRELKNIQLFKIYQPSANYILLKLLPEGLRVDELREKLIRERILIRNCSNFKGLNNRFLRLAIKDHESNQYLLKVLKGLQKSLPVN